MKEGNRKEIIENKREKRERKEDRVRERKLEKDLEKKKKKKNQPRREERTYRTLWPDALASYLPLCANLYKNLSTTF